MSHERTPDLVRRLTGAGFVAAADEAAELLAAAAGDPTRLEGMVARRLTGEPLEWITGRVEFCGLQIRIGRGVYVPRRHTEDLAELAARRLPEAGVAVDVCCGSGAIAAVLSARRPLAMVLATDLDPRAVACARANGVDAHLGDLFGGLPDELRGAVDVVAGVVPHVPSNELALLQRDTFTFEAPLAYDGGAQGLAILRRAVAGATRWLRPGGALLLGLGGDQADELALAGFESTAVLRDEDGDVRGIEGRRPRGEARDAALRKVGDAQPACSDEEGATVALEQLYPTSG